MHSACCAFSVMPGLLQLSVNVSMRALIVKACARLVQNSFELRVVKKTPSSFDIASETLQDIQSSGCAYLVQFHSLLHRLTITRLKARYIQRLLLQVPLLYATSAATKRSRQKRSG